MVSTRPSRPRSSVAGLAQPSRAHVARSFLAADCPLAICVDFGSTYTKALLVDLTTGEPIAGASHPTTIETDVMEGYDACLADLVAVEPCAAAAEVLACSSAGGGLRIAVVGNEELVTAEAGRRVALSSGGTVVAVVAAAEGAYAGLAIGARPDVVLLTGGTDGGNAEVLLAAARDLVESGWRGPVVVAGNVEAQAEVGAILVGVPHVLADNVVPQIGRLEPASARAAIREMFLAHVIGGKHLSARVDLATLVRGATPDVVLTGVELLARESGLDVAVVDIGGATTDVHSVVDMVIELDGATRDRLDREVVASTPVTRTVEGDLGMRWSAVTTVEAAGPDADSGLAAAAERRRAEPSYLPLTDDDRDDDEAIARAAAGLALRRHAGRSRVVVSSEGRVVERTGTDLREVDLLVGSGGVLRHGRPGVADRILAGSVGRDGEDVPGGWQLPRAPRVVVDDSYVLAAVGLLAEEHPRAAYALARLLLERPAPG